MSLHGLRVAGRWDHQAVLLDGSDLGKDEKCGQDEQEQHHRSSNSRRRRLANEHAGKENGRRHDSGPREELDPESPVRRKEHVEPVPRSVAFGQTEHHDVRRHWQRDLREHRRLRGRVGRVRCSYRW
jgi:hypothetical protein